MRYLFDEINWDQIEAVGFDMDGTLYDEYDFIQQVYRPISEFLAQLCNAEKETIYHRMITRWREKGSSYPYIFGEILDHYGVSEHRRKEIISRCLCLFRNFNPELILPSHVEKLLIEIRNKFPVFLVTDGQVKLQMNKIRSLGLNRHFDEQNIGITGSLGRGYEKPSCKILKQISVLDNIDPTSVVYFGDRMVDKLFSEQAGFHFVHVHCMRKVDHITYE